MKLHAKVGLVVLGITTVMITSAILAQPAIKIRVASNTASSGEEDEREHEAETHEVEGVEPTPEEFAQIEDLIAQLGAPTLAERDRAMSELAAFEKRALGQVREALTHDNDEIANRCSILEEVIESGQGELFLAARRLSLNINELKDYLNSNDVTPLLNILKARAQPGMVPLWAMIFARLSARSQLYPTAELCREIEGTQGYGLAMSRACEAPEIAGNAPRVARVIILLPPADARDTVESLATLRFTVSGGIEESLAAAYEARGVYEAANTLAAIHGRLDLDDENEEEQLEVRAAIALSLTDTCTGDELANSGLPPLTEMSPLILSQWLSLARRSGLNDVVSGVLPRLREAGADARRISIAAGAWADLVPVQEVLDGFDGLPYEAQLSVLDALWLNPREPKRLHPWLKQLLKHDHPGLRRASADHLGQYRAPSTVAALVQSVVDDAESAPVALQSLKPMADLLTPDQLDRLSNLLTDAGLATRTRLAEVLVAAGDNGGLQPLVDQWKKLLPRNELVLALKVLAQDASTPAGAFAAGVRASGLDDNEPIVDHLRDAADNGDLEMLRGLLSLGQEEGFALLEDMADDLDGSHRITSMTALALAGRDGDRIDDWIKRLAGEIKDPDSSRIGLPIAMSMTDQAEQFRRDALQQGNRSGNIRWVMLSVLAGRTQVVTREELAEVLFDTPENSTRWMGQRRMVTGTLTPKSARNVATALVYNESSSLINSPSMALHLDAQGVDMLEVLYGESENPMPRTPNEILLTALMGEINRARAIIKKVEPAEDGSNYLQLRIAGAWVNRDNGGERIARAVASSPANTFGTMWRLERARAGQIGALRSLLDAYGPDALRFERGATASVRLAEQRWGGPVMSLQGVAEAGFKAGKAPPPLEGKQLGGLFSEDPPGEWRDWWSARRALVQYDEATGVFTFVELS